MATNVLYKLCMPIVYIKDADNRKAAGQLYRAPVETVHGQIKPYASDNLYITVNYV